MRTHNNAGGIGDAISGPIFVVEVTDAGSGAAIILGKGAAAEPVEPGACFERHPSEPWDQVQLVGAVSVRLYSSPRERPGSKGAVSTSRTAQLEKEGQVAVAAGGTQVLAANPNRRVLCIQNTDAVDVRVSLGTAAADLAHAGFVLAASSAAGKGDGGSVNLTGWTGPVYVAGVGGAGNVNVEAF